MAEDSSDIRRIISLLDDPDENTALNAMAELLAREEESAAIPAEFQESSDPLMRKRIHQLQAALLLRRRRKYFLARMCTPGVDFFDLLIDLHLQWFDNDSRPELEDMLCIFLKKAMQKQPETLENISEFMLHENMTAEPDTTLKPEIYCIGSILQEHAGAASILTGIAAHLACGKNGIYAARILDDFALCDRSGKILLPAHSWQVLSEKSAEHIEKWDLRNIIRFGSANLFSSAVNSDSFRYILTIGQTLTGTDDDSVLGFLPYPFHPADELPGQEN